MVARPIDGYTLLEYLGSVIILSPLLWRKNELRPG
jgi:hypothetical protein